MPARAVYSITLVINLLADVINGVDLINYLKLYKMFVLLVDSVMRFLSETCPIKVQYRDSCRSIG